MAKKIVISKEERDALRALMFGERKDVWQVLAPIVNEWDRSQDWDDEDYYDESE